MTPSLSRRPALAPEVSLASDSVEGAAPSLPETGFRKPRRCRNRSRDWQSSGPRPHQRCAILQPSPDSAPESERRRLASETFGAGTIIDSPNGMPVTGV